MATLVQPHLRIATILRRVGRGSASAEPREVPTGSGVLRVGDLVVDTNRRQVTRDSERIGLTYTEFSLLELLFREPGRVVPRAEILEQLWGYPPRRAAPSRGTPSEMTRLWMSVGEQHGVAPGDVVGCILGETGLPPKTIGAVDIRERHTFVDVAAESAHAIISKLNRTAIRGQRLKVKLA